MGRLPFQELIVWKKSMSLTLAAYTLCGQLPRHEIFGLCAQIRRSAVSIPSNIAEGSQRGTDRDFANFLCIAKGSLAELMTQMQLAECLGYLPASRVSSFMADAQELAKILYSFHRRVSRS